MRQMSVASDDASRAQSYNIMLLEPNLKVLNVDECYLSNEDGCKMGVSIWADLWPLLWSGAAMNTDHVDHEH